MCVFPVVILSFLSCMPHACEHGHVFDSVLPIHYIKLCACVMCVCDMVT